MHKSYFFPPVFPLNAKHLRFCSTEESQLYRLNFMRVTEFWVNWSSRVVQQMSLLFIDAHRLSELLNITEVTLLSRSHTLKPPFITLSFNTGPARSPQSSVKHYSRAGEQRSSISYCMNTSYRRSGEHTAALFWAAFLQRCVLWHNIRLTNMNIQKKWMDGWMDRCMDRFISNN